LFGLVDSTKRSAATKASSSKAKYVLVGCFELTDFVTRGLNTYYDPTMLFCSQVSKEAFEKRFKQKAAYDDLDGQPEVKKWLQNMTYDRKG
jgi:hypothetical protein